MNLELIAQGSALNVTQAQRNTIADAFATSANVSASDVVVTVESAANQLQVEIIIPALDHDTSADTTLADLDEEDTQTKIDNVFGCDACTAVAVRQGCCRSAKVYLIITATIMVPDEADQDEMRSKLRAAFATASAATGVLGATVETTPVLTVVDEAFRVKVATRVTSAGQAAHLKAHFAAQLPNTAAATIFLSAALIVVTRLEAAPEAATATESPSPPPPSLPPLRCSLDFLSRGPTGEYSFTPDGNLAAEFLLASQIAAEIKEAHSNDPFTCRQAGPTGEGISIAPRPWVASASTSPYLPTISGREIACLDIAAFSTPGVQPLVAYGPETLVSSQAAAASNASAATFGGATKCGGVAIGDGTVNAYDVATFLRAHFRTPPYDAFDRDLSTVETVAPRAGMAGGCTHTAIGSAGGGAGGGAGWMGAGSSAGVSNASLSREAWVLMRTADYCGDGVGLGDDSASLRMRQRRRVAAAAAEVAPSLRSRFQLARLGARGRQAMRRRLGWGEGWGPSSSYAADLAAALLRCQTTVCLQVVLARSLSPPSPSPPPAFTALMTPVSLVSPHDSILVQRWAAIDGRGEWFRLVLPTTALVAELYLVNAPPFIASQLLAASPPEAGCSTTDCVPASAERMLVSFERRLDLLAGRVDPQDCATIETVGSKGVLADTISVHQRPPSAACPFDLFVWVPAALSAVTATSEVCGGAFAVDAASSINDGRSGWVQGEAACAVDLPALPALPPSPPSLPSPLPPDEPPMESSGPGDLGDMIGSLAVGPLSGWATLGVAVALVLLLLLCAAVCCCVCRRRRTQRWGSTTLITEVSGFRLGRAREARQSSQVVLTKRGEQPAPPPMPTADSSSGWLAEKLNTEVRV